MHLFNKCLHLFVTQAEQETQNEYQLHNKD